MYKQQKLLALSSFQESRFADLKHTDTFYSQVEVIRMQNSRQQHGGCMISLFIFWFYVNY